MPHGPKQDLIAIKEWMSKEPHLPEDLASEDELLMRFLHSCYFSLEATKKCIDRFCTTRAQMPEVYSSRDPLLPNVRNMLDKMAIGTYPFDGKEVIIHKLDDPTLEHFNFYDFLKSISILNDVWFKFHPHLADEHYVTIDMTSITLKIVPKLNITYLRDYLVYMLELTPVRVKKVICVNAPAYYEKLYALIKPILPVGIIEIIHIYTNVEGLYDFIDKKYLPEELGGDAESFYKQNGAWREKIIEFRKFYLCDDAWKTDLKKKPKCNTVEDSMQGSFRKLSID